MIGSNPCLSNDQRPPYQPAVLYIFVPSIFLFGMVVAFEKEEVLFPNPSLYLIKESSKAIREQKKKKRKKEKKEKEKEKEKKV
jgi:hypothetical protein